jgi:hypothetical protein
MFEITDYPVPVLLIIAGGLALFLTTGGSIEKITIGENQEKVIRWLGIITLALGLLWTGSLVVSDIFPEPTATPITIIVGVTPVPDNTVTIFPEQTAELTAVTIVTPRPESMPVPTLTPTLFPTDTREPANTSTSTATATPIATAAATATVTPIADVMFEVQSTTGDGTIYAGPGVDSRQALGVFQYQTFAEAIGRTQWNDWVEIKLETGRIGWVEASKVEFTAGQIVELPITWPRSGSGSGTGDGGSTGETGDCITVSLEEFDWPAQHFDDVTLNWSNWPADTARFRLTVWSVVEGEQRFVVPSTFSDLGTPTYTIGRWMFENEEFPPGLTFTYRIEPLNSSGAILCTNTGTFEQ